MSDRSAHCRNSIPITQTSVQCPRAAGSRDEPGALGDPNLHWMGVPSHLWGTGFRVSLENGNEIVLFLPSLRVYDGLFGGAGRVTPELPIHIRFAIAASDRNCAASHLQRLDELILRVDGTASAANPCALPLTA